MSKGAERLLAKIEDTHISDEGDGRVDFFDRNSFQDTRSRAGSAAIKFSTGGEGAEDLSGGVFVLLTF